jgi:hypothetical protein
MQNKQRGMTTFSIVFLIGGIAVAAFLVMKMLPPYIEYFSIKKVLAAMAKQEDLNNMTPPEIRNAYDRRASIDNIKEVEGKDLQISKEGGNTVVSAEYSVKIPLVANISAVIDFSESTAK